MDEEEMERVEFMARMELDSEERENIREEMEDILDWFSKIDEVDTEDVEPAFHPIDLKNEMREDEVEESFSREEALENTEHEEDGFFKGPKIR
ncbi:MAG: Asp-tRNA(Asn)/Glu-tRNA(Gln) amidotransferase subunit GatC [Candidatus Aenigmatarchaeota archaeon]